MQNNDIDNVNQTGNYQTVKFNAMKHGILSRLTVLPHEDAGEFSNIYEALLEEHKPTGMTEQHLVEELASIMWRKRRVLMAEAASINRGLNSSLSDHLGDSPIPASVPFEKGLSNRDIDLHTLMKETPEEATERHMETKIDLAATQKAAKILTKGGKDAYEIALRTLLSDSRDWWDEYLETEEYQATVEGLAEFINEHLEPLCIRIETEARYQPEIKAQILSEGLKTHQLGSLNRYETHLDRKFEKTLAMLLKLRELRKG